MEDIGHFTLVQGESYSEGCESKLVMGTELIYVKIKAHETIEEGGRTAIKLRFVILGNSEEDEFLCFFLEGRTTGIGSDDKTAKSLLENHMIAALRRGGPQNAEKLTGPDENPNAVEQARTPWGV